MIYKYGTNILETNNSNLLMDWFSSLIAEALNEVLHEEIRI